MLSTEKSLFSPWPAVSSLSLSTWPEPGADLENSENYKNNKIIGQRKWQENFGPSFTSSSEPSPTYVSDVKNKNNNFTFGNDLNLDNIDQLAAKLLNISDDPDTEVRPGSGLGHASHVSETGHVSTTRGTCSPVTTESDIHLNLPQSSSNPR